MEGRTVLAPMQKNYSAGKQLVTINTSRLSAGTYFVEVGSGNAVTRMKMIVVR
jgi:hypothetical protein